MNTNNDSRVNHNPMFRAHLILNTLVHIAMGVVIYIVWHNAIQFITNQNLKLHIIFSSTGVSKCSKHYNLFEF